MTDQEIESLVRKGRKIFPVKFRDKSPAHKGWNSCITQSEDEILSAIFTERLKTNGDMNLGMVVGEHSDVLTIDLDFKHPEAEKFWQDNEDSLRMGVLVNTGNGKHCHFKHPGEGKVISAIGGISRGVDLLCDTKTDDGTRYVLIPHSTHASGAKYHYDEDNPFGGLTLADDLPTLPFTLEAVIYDRSSWTGHVSEAQITNQMVAGVDPAEWYADNPHALFSVDPFDDEPILEGNRNNDMAKIAGKLLYMNEGNDNYLITDLISDMAEINTKRCDPALPEEEINALCDSIWKTSEKKAERKKKDMELLQKNQGLNGYKFRLSPDDIIGSDEGTPARAGSAFAVGVMPAPDYMPDPRQEPNKAALWVLHQDLYAPSQAGAEHNLIYLGEQFYVRYNNVWREIRDRDVESTFQLKYPDSKRAEILNMLSFTKNYLYMPLVNIPFWKSGSPPPNYPDDPRKLIAFNNGLFDVDCFIKTNDIDKSMLPFTDNFFNTVKLPYNLNANATCPEWQGFLASIWGSAKCDRAEALREWMGHMMLPDITQQKIAVLHGVPRSGKSTIGKVIHRMAGVENTAATSMASLSTDHGTAGLVGKTMAILFDAHLPSKALGDRCLESLKSISGGDPQVINRKFCDTYTTTLTSRFTIICNEMPKLKDSGNALLARMIPFRFEESFAGRERQNLESVLYDELEGIAVWALEGVRRYITRGSLMTPKEAVQDLQEIKRVLNPTSAFADDCLIFPTANPADEVLLGELYKVYRAWAEDNNMLYTESKDRLLSKLKSLCPYAKPVKKNGQQYWKGVKMRDEAKSLLSSAAPNTGNLF
jgi:P4 family phage/plasmid primase-like protien